MAVEQSLSGNSGSRGTGLNNIMLTKNTLMKIGSFCKKQYYPVMTANFFSLNTSAIYFHIDCTL